MAVGQKVKHLVYGLGALGGGAAILSQYYSNGDLGLDPRVHVARIRAQLLAETEGGVQQWAWPKWDHNWDQRAPPPADPNNNVAGGAVASRHLLLIRHGQYNLKGETDKERYLTELGRSQAAATGARLAELSLPYTHILHSNMSRAVETADLIAEQLPSVTVLPSDAILREGSPIKPEPPVGSWRPEAAYWTDGARIEAAFRKHFHRAEAEQREDSYEVVVCHANVIRYFVCRALQLPPEAWLRISLKHASVTWLTIRPDGRVSIRSLGEAGHLKPDMLTTS